MTQSEKTIKLNAVMQLQIEEMTKIIEAQKNLDTYQKMEEEIRNTPVEEVATV